MAQRWGNIHKAALLTTATRKKRKDKAAHLKRKGTRWSCLFMCCSQHDEPRRGKSRGCWRRPITIIIIKGLWAGGHMKRYSWGIYVVTCYHSLLRFTGHTQGSFDSTRCVKCGTRQKEVQSEAMGAEARPLRGGFNRSQKKTDYFAVKVNVKKMLSFTPRVYCVWLCIHLHRAFATALCVYCYLLAEKLPSGETNRLNFFFFLLNRRTDAHSVS